MGALSAFPHSLGPKRNYTYSSAQQFPDYQPCLLAALLP